MSGTLQALVVDDMPINRLLAVRLLRKKGWEVGEAEDGPSTLAWLDGGRRIDLILLDISMPGISGQELCRIIRERQLGGPDVKIVAYTAHAMAEDTAAFRAEGFDAVLVKPIGRQSMSDILAVVGFTL